MRKHFNNKVLKAFVLSIFLCICLYSLSGCSKKSEDDGSDHSVVVTLLNNPQNLDPQLAVDRSSIMVIKNMFSGLMTINSDGEVVCGISKSYEISDDGLLYRFELKDDCFWYNGEEPASPVTAHDFVFAFKRIFDPVTRSPYKERFSFLENARQIIDGELDHSKLGVYATSSLELVFKLDRPCSEFLYLLTTAPAMPCNMDFFESTKARYGLDDKSVISNGAFYMTQWSYDPYGNDNLIYMKRNYENSVSDRVFPKMLTFVIERDPSEIYDQFDDSETDCIVSEKSYKNSKGSNISKKYEYSSVGILFNSDEDIDSNVKKALSLNVNRNQLDSSAVECYKKGFGIIPGYYKFNNIKYREKYKDSELPFYGEKYVLSEDEISDFNSLSEEELKIMVKIGSDGGCISKLVEHWYDKLGISLTVDYVEEDEYQKRLDSKDYFMAFTGIESDDNSVYYYLENAFHIIDPDDESDVSGLLDEALSCIEAERKEQIFQEIENRLISTGNYIPLFYKKEYFVCKKDTEDWIFDPFSRYIDFRYVKHF